MNKLKNYFSYPKFKSESLKILYLNDDYFLQQASIGALQELGHEVYPLQLVRDPSQMLERLLKTCVMFKPDCLMGINHGGYDPEGKIAAIVDELHLPVIFWYLDDFRFIIFNGKHHANENTAVFTFEKNHVALLKSLGFEHVFYLPSAASMRPHGLYQQGKYNYLKKAVSFVGNTFDQTKTLRQKPHYQQLLEKVQQEIDFTRLQDTLVSQVEKVVENEFREMDDLFHFAGFVIAEATQKYRQYMLGKMNDSRFHLFGDPQWKKLVNIGKIHPPTRYETETPYVYHNSLINVNLSSQQLEETVSLRIFDVPAAGGFLLTDWKESLIDLFDAEHEIVAFHSPEEMNEKIAYFRKNPNERESILKKARERVVNEHLIIHRMKQMVEKCRKIWGNSLKVKS